MLQESQLQATKHATHHHHGLTVQALWSYTNEEIVIGEKLRPIVSRERGKWVVDFSRFNEVITA